MLLDKKNLIKRCFNEAYKGAGFVSPNPLVGALIVKNNEIIGVGHHEIYGGPHAEVNAIKNSSKPVEGATLYCSLEPCCHTNKQTPPCTELIIKSKIKKVIIANLDPNSEVSGKGVKILENAGIEVEYNVLQDEGEIINEIFFKYIKNNVPFVHLKMAQTLDGRVCTNTGDSKWISDESARTEVHQLRFNYDAVMVGRTTLEADNPSLNIRLVESRGKIPYRIIVGNPNKMDFNKTILSDKNTEKTIIITSEVNIDHQTKSLIEERSIKVIQFQGVIDFNKALKELGEMKISSILVEGGAKLASTFIEERLFDKISIYIAPKMIGNGSNSYNSEKINLMKDAINFKRTSIKTLNDQIVFEGYC